MELFLLGFNPFHVTSQFLYLLKTENLSILPENVRKPRFSDVFRWLEKGFLMLPGGVETDQLLKMG